MPSSATSFEHRVNYYRGLVCFVITLASLLLVFIQPSCLLFWRDGAYELNAEGTGTAGTLTSLLFLTYLFVDSMVGIVCRSRFRRPMLAVHIHHVVVGTAVACFLLPSPPRGFFLYVWGEALTAVRLLPPQPRFFARTCVFAARRCLWLYLLFRDATFFPQTSLRFGRVAAVVPMGVALLLLVLDAMWWREHAKSGASGAGSGGGASKRNDGASISHSGSSVDLEAGQQSPSGHTSEEENGHLLKLSPPIQEVPPAAASLPNVSRVASTASLVEASTSV